MALANMITRSGHLMRLDRESRRASKTGAAKVQSVALIVGHPVMCQPLGSEEVVRQVERGIDATHVVYSATKPCDIVLGDRVTITTPAGTIVGVARSTWRDQAGQNRVFSLIIDEAGEARGNQVAG